MTKQDTSQIGICKNSLRKLQDITHQVNKSTSKIRLQGAKLFESSGGKELLVLDFYPHFRDLAWVLEAKELVGVELGALDRSQLKSSKHPFLLYLKAHFVGHELQEVFLEEQKIRFSFAAQRSFEWDFASSTWSFTVEGRKDYKQRLPDWAHLSSFQPREEKESSTTPQQNKAEIKFEKLKKNVESDFAEASLWLEKNKAGIEFFFQSPQLWGERLDKIPKEFHAWIEDISKLLSFATPRKIALEKLKALQSRYQRKFEKAQQRLAELNASAPQLREKKQSAPTKNTDTKTASYKRVSLSSDVEAVVGRKAHENDELFRKAHSRDLWFHVRGQRGSHVWVRRGQKGFGAKDELSENLIKKAATLAAQYSKASGGWVSVDYTERRFLKKLKGSDAGAVQVLQSKTIFVSMDEEK